MKKKQNGNVDKLGTHLCHRIFVNEGHPRDREMLSTALLIGFETLKYIQDISRMNNDDTFKSLIKSNLKMMKDVLDGKIAIRYGETIKVVDGAPPN